MQESISSRILGYLLIAVACWGLFYPKPYEVVAFLNILLPWLGLWMIKFWKNHKRPHRHLVLGSLAFLVLPGFVLFEMTRPQFHALRWAHALWLAITISLVLTIAIFRRGSWSGRQGWIPAITFLFFLLYGYGAGMQTNALLDHSAPTIYTSRVISQFSSVGRGHRSYRLEIGPWGPDSLDQTISVPQYFYESKLSGDSVCVALRPGFLHVKWYAVGHCTKDFDGGFIE